MNDTQNPKTGPEKKSQAAANDAPACFEDLQDADHLAHEMDKLANNYEPLRDLDGIGDQLQALKDLTVAYRDGLAAADALARQGGACIADLKERTKLAVEELQRLEDDGGPAPTKEQQDQKEALAKAAKKIDRIAPVIERQFGSGDKDAA